MIQRYDLVAKTVHGEAWQELEPHPEGDWCRYEDAQAEIEQLRAENTKLWGWYNTLAQERAKAACTCPSGDGSLRWPCPAHPKAEKAGGNHA